LIQIKDSTDARALQLFYPKYEGSAMAVTNVELPLVYACSGCSSAVVRHLMSELRELAA
jgi:uncharacterized metal-binding protein